MSGILKDLLCRIWFAFGPLAGPTIRGLLASSIGTFAWRLDRHGRRHLETNLRTLLPSSTPAARQRLSRQCYQHFITHCFDITRLSQPLRRYLGTEVIDPHDRGRQALQQGSIATTAHVNWETCLALGHRLGLFPESHAIALKSDQGPLSQLIANQRAAVGCTTLWHQGPPLAALRALREGTSLLIVADRSYSATTFSYQHQSIPWQLPAGPAALAVQTDAPIIPLILLIPPRKSPRILIHPPLYPDVRLPPRLRIQHLAQRHARALLWLLSKGSNQWVAFQPLFHLPRSAT
jgi:KDO2-lipid IV(A) lauroyltransferase